MTDEEKNVRTDYWPSRENIVSFFFFLPQALADSLTLT